MATNIAALGKPKSAQKGEPPKRTKSAPVIKTDTRPSQEKGKGIQFMIPPSVIDDFGREAGENFGFTKGSKSQMFLKLFEFYNQNKALFKETMKTS